jgi:hypothetical protein
MIVRTPVRPNNDNDDGDDDDDDVTRAAKIQTAGLCHHGDGACACWAFGMAGGDHGAGWGGVRYWVAALAGAALGPVSGYGSGADQLGGGGGVNGAG